MSLFRSFDGMCWPSPGERLDALEWACRYGNGGLTQSDFMCLAGIVAAYRELVKLSASKRDPIIRQLRSGPSLDRPAESNPQEIEMSKYQVRFCGSEEWMNIAPYANADERSTAEHAIYLHGLRHARNVREVSPGFWRGLIGRRVSPTVQIRSAAGHEFA